MEKHDLALHFVPNIPWYELYFVEGPSWDRQIKVYKKLARVLRVNTYPDPFPPYVRKVLGTVCDTYAYVLIECLILLYFASCSILSIIGNSKIKELLAERAEQESRPHVAAMFSVSCVESFANFHKWFVETSAGWLTRKLARNLVYQFCVSTVLPFIAEVGGPDVATKSITEITGRELTSAAEHTVVRSLVDKIEAQTHPRPKGPLTFHLPRIEREQAVPVQLLDKPHSALKKPGKSGARKTAETPKQEKPKKKQDAPKEEKPPAAAVTDNRQEEPEEDLELVGADEASEDAVDVPEDGVESEAEDFVNELAASEFNTLKRSQKFTKKSDALAQLFKKLRREDEPPVACSIAKAVSTEDPKGYKPELVAEFGMLQELVKECQGEPWILVKIGLEIKFNWD